MNELHTDEKWSDAVVAVASCTDEPSWADECLSKFVVNEDGVTLKDIVTVEEIHKGSKSGHLKNISNQTGIALEDMMFFDNERGNCETVAKLGVTVVFCPKGVTKADWDLIENFPQPGEILQVQ